MNDTVLETPVALLLDLLSISWAKRADGSLECSFVQHSCAALASLLVSDREFNALGRRKLGGRGRVALSKGTLALTDHVEVHEGGARDVEEKDGSGEVPQEDRDRLDL